MKKFVVILFLLGMGVSCGRNGNLLQPSNGLPATESYSVIPVQVDGSAKFSANASINGDDVLLTLRAENAESLRGVGLEVALPGKDYALISCEFTDFVGPSDAVISFAGNPVDGILPIGVVRIHPSESDGVSGSGEIATLHLRKNDSLPLRSVSIAPTGEDNQIKDLTAVPTGNENEYLLTWKEVNVGDYNNSGKVEISDIFPIADHFFARRSDVGADEEELFDILDGDRSGTIDIGDVFPLADHFFCECAGYNVYKGAAILGFAERPTDYDVTKRVPYSYGPLTVSGSEQFFVAPVDRRNQEGVKSLPAYIAPTPEPPPAPTGLTATTGPQVGFGNVFLTWNTMSNISGYKIYRRLAGETSFGSAIAQRYPMENNYTDTGLPGGNTYEYAITAVNAFGESDYSNIVEATPYYPEPPLVPTLSATGEGLPEGEIEVSWTYSGSTEYLAGFELERKEATSPNFTLIATPSNVDTHFRDHGLTIGTTYVYRIRAVDIFDRKGDYSNEASAEPGTLPPNPAQIISLTTNRYTFGPEGGTATLTVVVDPPDADITWSASAGNITGSGTTATWNSSGVSAPQKVTITCTATSPGGSDTETIDLIVTTLPILGDPINFSAPSRDQPNQPYLGLSDYTKDHFVILLDFGAKW